jgi:hypothetical protein
LNLCPVRGLDGIRFSHVHTPRHICLRNFGDANSTLIGTRMRYLIQKKDGVERERVSVWAIVHRWLSKLLSGAYGPWGAIAQEAAADL